MGNAGNAIVLIVFGLLTVGLLVGVGVIELPEEPIVIQPETGITQAIPFDWTGVYIGLIVFPIVIFLLSGIRIVRQTHRAVIETFGKYTRFMSSGITWVVPIVQRLYALNVTEQLVDVQQQDVITLENLNAKVDAQVYYRVGESEKELQNAFYNVDNVNRQMVQLAKTTLRAVIGQKMFKDVNSKRAELNDGIFETLQKETKNWGITIVRVELKEIEPPDDVQKTMNAIIKAENTRDASRNLAKAKKIEAEGDKMARIQRAEGFKRENVLQAEGEAEAIRRVAEADADQIKLVNTSAQSYFRKEAVVLKHLQVTENSLENNSKIILTKDGIQPTLVLNESAKDIIPTPTEFKRTKEEQEQLDKDMSTSVTRRRTKSKRNPKSKIQDYIDPEAVKLFD